MTGKSPVRSCEDIDGSVLNYAEVKSLATGNPYIKEKMALDIEVSKLKLLKASHARQKYQLEDDITMRYPQSIAALKEKIAGLQADIRHYQDNKPADKEDFRMTVAGREHGTRKEAGTALLAEAEKVRASDGAVPVGTYLGMGMSVTFEPFFRKFTLALKGNLSHKVELGADASGNITRIQNALEGMGKQLAESKAKLEGVERRLEIAKAEVDKPFAQESELAAKLERLAQLNALLDMDGRAGNATAKAKTVPDAAEAEVKHQPLEDGQSEQGKAGQEPPEQVSHEAGQEPPEQLDQEKPVQIQSERLVQKQPGSKPPEHQNQEKPVQIRAERLVQKQPGPKPPEHQNQEKPVQIRAERPVQKQPEQKPPEQAKPAHAEPIQPGQQGLKKSLPAKKGNDADKAVAAFQTQIPESRHEKNEAHGKNGCQSRRPFHDKLEQMKKKAALLQHQGAREHRHKEQSI